eukprot:TRINITY_DN3172_c0_g3_i1.p1 TRINITY_DN3172_c0_g3~~TRINITY_DN3172_c0_g3_i1.p1  ORF type:complete len:840 (+),score=226.31 TRINITY_DN3172_c0_g3_i1:340-2859(+)
MDSPRGNLSESTHTESEHLSEDESLHDSMQEHDKNDEVDSPVLSSAKVVPKDTPSATTLPQLIGQDCIFLLLESRVLLKELILARLKQDRWAHGNLTIDEIGNLLRSQKEEAEGDWVSEIQELKRNLVSEVRRNYALERELGVMDQKIELLIKSHGAMGHVTKDEKGKQQKKSGKEGPVREKFDLSSSEPKRLALYQNLFYLLQTEPKYLANLVYLMSQDDMERFLDTVILSLFGDAYSPREEFLLLSLFKNAISREINSINTILDFCQAESVVPKMVVTYNKRKQGSEYLRTALGPVLINAIRKDVNLELKPSIVYQAIISEREIRTGEKTAPDMRNLTDDQIMQQADIRNVLAQRERDLLDITEQFFKSIIATMNRLPYGIRWICKQIGVIAEKKFGNGVASSRRTNSPLRLDVLKVTGYYIYYRFINLLIVTPDSFEVVKPTEVSINARKNLVMVSKVLQHLFNNTRFTEKWLLPLNDWIVKNTPAALQYLEDLLDVADPEDHLNVDKYVELTQKTKPVVVISLIEVASTHNILHQHIDELAKDPQDKLKIILKELDAFGPPPEVARDDDREVQLTLSSKFEERADDEDSNASLYQETKNLVVKLLKTMPIPGQSSLASTLSSGLEYAKANKNAGLEDNIRKISENLQKLSAQGVVDKSDGYAAFLRDVALEVANRQAIREQRQREIKRLDTTLKNLRRHQTYLNDQMAQWNNYLADVKAKSYAVKKKTKKSKAEASSVGPFKFTGSQLLKKGVISEAEVPLATLKKMTFQISSDMQGGFEVAASLAGVEVKALELQYDDLLQKNASGLTKVELDQITLDVNMTLHLLNKLFMGQK